eukprot:10075086-Lingulodinium_polyedra.AAC.1
MAAVIASVDDRLRAMLAGHDESKAHLQKKTLRSKICLAVAMVFLELHAMIIRWLICATLAFVQFSLPVS